MSVDDLIPEELTADLCDLAQSDNLHRHLARLERLRMAPRIVFFEGRVGWQLNLESRDFVMRGESDSLAGAMEDLKKALEAECAEFGSDADAVILLHELDQLDNAESIHG